MALSSRKAAPSTTKPGNTNSNVLFVTPEQLRLLLGRASLQNARKIELVNNGAFSIPQIFRTIRSAVEPTAKAVLTGKASLRSVTIRTNRLSNDELSLLKAQGKAGRGLKVVESDVGVWKIAILDCLKVNLVHTQIRNAWRYLQADPRIDAKKVARAIHLQGAAPDARRLTSLYLFQAALATERTLDKRGEPWKAKQSWEDVSTTAFVKPYLDRALRQVDGTGGKLDTQERVSVMNAVLLDVIQPINL
jgi:hypothetical protein